MTTVERISLLDPRLELTRHLTAGERAELGSATLPVVSLDAGELELAELLRLHNAFGATLLDGMVLNALRIGDQTGIQLLGPGDLLVQPGELWPRWLSDFTSRTSGPVRLGLLGNDLLAAAYRWPRIVQGLYSCVADQVQRLTAQLVICQLPRVDERVLTMMWLLAETWGQVTPGGIRLPLLLTHETLGALVGARRPTVTLALRKLTEQGSIVHQDAGWLLLESAPEPTGPLAGLLPPGLAETSLATWAAVPAIQPDPSVTHAELRETVSRLREQHRIDRQHTREQLTRVHDAREAMVEIRQRISRDAITRRRPPSS